MPRRSLLVYDFDQSLLDDDSDRFVQALAAPALRDDFAVRARTTQWTDLMDHVVVQLQTQQGLGEPELRAALADIAFDPAMRAAVAEAHAAGVELLVLSDANALFIDAVLTAHALRHAFAEVITNPVARDPHSGLLRVHRRVGVDDPPHGCPRCGPNLCKGTELRRYRTTRGPFDRVVYVGDGRNDICPTLDLTAVDAVLARRGLPLHQHWDAQPAHAAHPRVHAWDTAGEVRALLPALLYPPSL